ncbi:hypothetical protein BGZ65_008783 [Modicella reniformis]|uniref:Uncharacterized protein n=1 Tax=Modicella reniformis TaxID=1440133 RepID=A0A9P6MK30_9FUNG|nr:hypothetical protein BGZ65_008783 [Modicella reniformis]
MLALTTIFYFWMGRIRPGKNTPPRGKPIPRLKSRFFMFDVAYQFIKSRADGDELKWVQGLSKQGFTLTTDVIGHCLILAFEPSSVQHMLVKNFENYPKGRPQFQVKEYKGAAHIETQINQVFDMLNKAIATGGGEVVIDVQDLWSRYTIDTATGFHFGNCINALDVPQSKFSVDGKCVVCDYQSLVIAPEFPQKVKDMDAILLPIVDAAIAKEVKRRAEAVQGEKNEHQHDNLLMHFLNSADENGQPFDRIYIST